MSKYLPVFFFLNLSVYLSAQCTGDYLLNTQEDVDSFLISHAN